MASAAGTGFLRAGDMFLAFVGEKIHINIDYENHSGFLSCFRLKFIELENPVFTLKDFDLALASRKAFIEPGFDRVLREKKITLACDLENTSFLNPRGRAGDPGELAELFQGSPSLLVDELAGLVFEHIHTDLVIYGETVEFPAFEAGSKDVKLYASGYITESGDFDIKVKLFFSPRVARGFPEELKMMLTEKSRGWFSYFLHVESGKGMPSLKLESDRFKLDFDRLEVK